MSDSVEVPNYCSVCDKHFTTKAYLEVHIKRHLGTKNYQCRICPKRFITGFELTNHIRTHTKSKPFVCSVCGKGFAQRSSAQIHLRVHSTERAYECTVCSKGFRYAATLKQHVRVHNNERSYRCETCERTFVDPSTYARHTRTHTGEKRYKCTVCDRRFSQRGNLIRHKRNVSCQMRHMQKSVHSSDDSDETQQGLDDVSSDYAPLHSNHDDSNFSYSYVSLIRNNHTAHVPDSPERCLTSDHVYTKPQPIPEPKNNRPEIVCTKPELDEPVSPEPALENIESDKTDSEKDEFETSEPENIESKDLELESNNSGSDGETLQVVKRIDGESSNKHENLHVVPSPRLEAALILTNLFKSN